MKIKIFRQWPYWLWGGLLALLFSVLYMVSGVLYFMYVFSIPWEGGNSFLGQGIIAATAFKFSFFAYFMFKLFMNTPWFHMNHEIFLYNYFDYPVAQFIVLVVVFAPILLVILFVFSIGAVFGIIFEKFILKRKQ